MVLRQPFQALAAVAAACGLMTATAAAGPALLYDAQTRQVLYAEDADHVWFPASLAKLMTAYVVFETWKAGKAAPTDRIAISARANSRPRVRLGLGAGKSISYEEAMAALILHSANDIAVALAEAVAGSEEAFVETMNATAARLGMASTRFINASGLPGEGQHSTARDLARLTQALMYDFPEHGALFAQLQATVGPRRVATHNPAVMRVEGGDGMKTGFTCSAGYNIVASATRDGIRLVAIVLGERTPALRQARMAALLEHGFRLLEWKAVFEVTTLDTLPVEPFDVAAVRAANLDKRLQDCKGPEPPTEADCQPGSPGSPSQTAHRSAGRAVRLARAMRTAKPTPVANPGHCSNQAVAATQPPAPARGSVAGKQVAGKQVAGKQKAPPARAANVAAAKRPPTRARGEDSVTVFGAAGP